MRADLDGIRVAPVFEGGPQLVLPTHYVARADCSRGILTLSAGGGAIWSARFDDSSQGLAELGTAMCEVPLP